ncbi:hypothetical protein FPV67DRAFT_1460854 [Lyophyllum atratum]|nr:hypothetical protein FPV67DRAFT_1460854 [Lyophyllum atratum]
MPPTRIPGSPKQPSELEKWLKASKTGPRVKLACTILKSQRKLTDQEILLMARCRSNTVLLVKKPTILRAHDGAAHAKRHPTDDTCQAQHWRVHRVTCKKSRNPDPTLLAHALTRWDQIYGLDTDNIYSVLAGLRRGQSRAEVQAIVSRTAFQVLVTSKTLGKSPKSHRDLRLIRCEVVDRESLFLRGDRDILAEMNKTSDDIMKEENGSAEFDVINIAKILIYIADPHQDDFPGTDDVITHTCHMFSKTVGHVSAAGENTMSGGLPVSVTIQDVQMLFKAHLDDEENGQKK